MLVLSFLRSKVLRVRFPVAVILLPERRDLMRPGLLYVLPMVLVSLMVDSLMWLILLILLILSLWHFSGSLWEG